MASRIALLATLSLLSAACAVTSHAVRPSELGVSRRSADLLSVIDTPGPLEVETVNAADWEVPLGGLVNLDHPKAKAAQLKDHGEPIQVFFHVIRHPSRGMFIVDTGIERARRDDPDHAAPTNLIKRFMHLEKLVVHAPLGEWLAKQPTPVQGVMMTHLHIDHISGMPDVPHGTPIYTGPGEATSTAFMNMFVRSTTNRELDGQAALQEWIAKPDEDHRFEAVVDVFGDGSLWALWVPGHTPGSMAYLARTTKGPVLFVGDTSHTSWGWKEGVEPGSFTGDQARNADSLARLEKLVAEHPSIDVRLGHQSLK